MSFKAPKDLVKYLKKMMLKKGYKSTPASKMKAFEAWTEMGQPSVHEIYEVYGNTAHNQLPGISSQLQRAIEDRAFKEGGLKSYSQIENKIPGFTKWMMQRSNK